MTRFTDWVESRQQVVEGHLACHFCGDVVTKGRYSKKEKMLYYVCTKNHENKVPYEL